MKTALLSIDIQNDYFENGTMSLVDAAQASRNARLILDKFRADNQSIVHIQHIATRPTATFFLPDTWGAEIHDTVKPLEGEKVIVKHYPNSFRETELFDYLSGQQITDLVICGMMTHMCVDATVRAAKDLGFNVILIGDACSTKSLEIQGQTVAADDVQKSFLAALNYFYSTVMTTQTYLEEHSKI
ncbi:MAG: cysteine hydrolase family protein [Bacteroidales bacterium]|nr:cysteine hydrolase family protein [Bacteroidales bacterium]